MYALHLEIPALPKSLNTSFRANKWGRYKADQGWDLLIWEMVKDKLPEVPLSKARITITRNFYRMLDYDGLVGSMKPVVDALVTAGVLADDNWEVTGPWSVDQKFRAKKAGPLLVVSIDES